jgi:two-component sensor histidine kinase
LLFAAVQALLSVNQAKTDRRNAILIISDDAIDRVEQVLVTSESYLNLFEEDIIDGECERVLSKLRTASAIISNVSKFDANGVSVCSGTQPAVSTLSPDRLAALHASSKLVLRSEAFANETNQGVMALYKKHFDEDGNLAGVAEITLKLSRLEALADRSVENEVEIALADKNGKVFGSGRFEELDVQNLALAPGSERGQLLVRTKNGTKMDIVIRSVEDEKLFAVISRPSPGLFSEFSVAPARTIGLPLLAFSVALLAVWLALDWYVLRWLTRLKALSRSYGAGYYDIEVTGFEHAPDELADLSFGMATMARKISDRDESLTSALETRDAAVKEIHHRVKNNLQIVTSFLNLQTRQMEHGEAKSALSLARQRIDALSIVHETLYQNERLETVDIKAFLDRLLTHLSDALGMPEANVTLKRNLIDGSLEADSAIPIALFIVEAVTNAIKYAFDETGGEILVTLEDGAEDELLLSVADDGVGTDLGETTSTGTGIGQRLMSAFAKQLGGEVKYTSSPGHGFSALLRLPSRTGA